MWEEGSRGKGKVEEKESGVGEKKRLGEESQGHD